MAHKAPPVPPDQRNRSGGSSPPGRDPETSHDPAGGNAEMNLKEQGRSGNIRQNTANHARQQDR